MAVVGTGAPIFSIGVSRSDTYTLNRLGESGQPCRSPRWSSKGSDRAVPTCTRTWDVRESSASSLNSVPRTPISHSLALLLFVEHCCTLWRSPQNIPMCRVHAAFDGPRSHVWPAPAQHSGGLVETLPARDRPARYAPPSVSAACSEPSAGSSGRSAAG